MTAYRCFNPYSILNRNPVNLGTLIFQLVFTVVQVYLNELFSY